MRLEQIHQRCATQPRKERGSEGPNCRIVKWTCAVSLQNRGSVWYDMSEQDPDAGHILLHSLMWEWRRGSMHHSLGPSGQALEGRKKASVRLVDISLLSTPPPTPTLSLRDVPRLPLYAVRIAHSYPLNRISPHPQLHAIPIRP